MEKSQFLTVNKVKKDCHIEKKTLKYIMYSKQRRGVGDSRKCIQDVLNTSFQWQIMASLHKINTIRRKLENMTC